MTRSFSANGRTYRLPERPIVVICVDGSSDDYLDAALIRGRMPNLQGLILRGYRGLARAALPTFTNVNNVSIVTGVPPAVHGICGNFFLNPETGEEMMMNSSAFLRAETILAAAANAGRQVAVVTAKDKLRELLSYGLKGIAFSSEKADQTNLETHGITDVEQIVGERTPPIYSGDASVFVLTSGVALLAKKRADFVYLSLTDYIQHKFAPEASEAIEFYSVLDHEMGRLLELGAILGITADHGMNAKQTPAGEPNVIYLETLLSKEIGKGVRVILPITDPYVVHHGALGSFAVVHLPDAAMTERVQKWLLQFSEVTEVYDRATAAVKLELPPDRIGDLVVMSRRDVVLGRTPEHHDLTRLEGKLRSHGGRYEEMVPFLISELLTDEYTAKASGDPRNFDIFDFTLNGVAE